MSRLIRITLEARFGSLSDDVRAAIDTAPEATLEAVATGLASEPLDQIRARLGLS